MQPDNQFPTVVQPDTNNFSPAPKDPPKKSYLKIIFIALGVIFLLAIVAAVLMSNNQNSEDTSQTPSQAQNVSTTPGKATALDVENVNNAISQSLGSLNDEQDFPPNKLDDKSLGL